jgi:hypothetical protein
MYVRLVNFPKLSKILNSTISLLILCQFIVLNSSNQEILCAHVNIVNFTQHSLPSQCKFERVEVGGAFVKQSKVFKTLLNKKIVYKVFWVHPISR